MDSSTRVGSPSDIPSNVAEAVVSELMAAGVRHIIYVPGGPLMPFLSAAFRRSYFTFVLSRHEAGAAFIAEGLARATRSVALAAVTAGPGVTNAVTPVYVAYREMTPVFLLSAQVSRARLGQGAAQELETAALLRPVTKQSETLVDGRLARGLVREFLALTTSGRPGPVHLSVPADVWKENSL
jgi:acetolactate synthase-1/2/3 large subunit